jgi:hypothetical protein
MDISKLQTGTRDDFAAFAATLPWDHVECYDVQGKGRVFFGLLGATIVHGMIGEPCNCGRDHGPDQGLELTFRTAPSAEIARESLTRAIDAMMTEVNFMAAVTGQPGILTPANLA